MIVFDTETSGLVGNPELPLDQQPEIVEFGAMMLSDIDLTTVRELSLLIKPKRPIIPDKKGTKITNEMLVDAPSFARVLPRISDFFLGQKFLVGHNLPFDLSMLRLELMRLDRVCRFPWPPEQLCTADISAGIFGERKRLGVLYTHATGKTLGERAHRALADVEATVDVVRWMRAEGHL